MHDVLWLTNVTLEIGEEQEASGVVKTKTALFNIKVVDGKIKAIKDIHQQIPLEDIKYDVAKKLAMPTFKEMHNHLDKTYMTLGWQACKPVSNLQERLRLEAEESLQLKGTVKRRAEQMLKTYLSKGVTHIRTHVNIDPYVGLQNLVDVKEVLDSYKDKITSDIVAFPQQGLFLQETPSLMRQAFQHGATMVGGIDPAGIEGNVEKALYETMDIAVQYDADIDIHLHDGGHLGFYTLDKWIDIVEEASYKGRTAISHAFCLGDVPSQLQNMIARRLSQQQIDIMSTVPLVYDRNLPPIELLDDHQVKVHFGCDGFYDSWSPYGTGDVLEKVTRFSEKQRRIDEKSLRLGLKWITGGVTPLDDQGNRVWPKENMDANFIFVDASSTAEVVARKPDKRFVMYKGKFQVVEDLTLE